jgi:hypothetical protein
MGVSLTLPDSVDERLLALARHWQSTRPSAGGLPMHQHFAASGVGALLPWVWLFEVHRPDFRFRYRRLDHELAFRYRYLGPAHAAAMGRENTGRWVNEVRPRLRAEPGYDLFIAAAEQGRVGYYKGPPTYPVGQSYAGIERLILPLARDGSTVDMLLGITVYAEHGAGRRVDSETLSIALAAPSASLRVYAVPVMSKSPSSTASSRPLRQPPLTSRTSGAAPPR